MSFKNICQYAALSFAVMSSNNALSSTAEVCKFYSSIEEQSSCYRENKTDKNVFSYWAGWTSSTPPNFNYSGNILTFSVLEQTNPPYSFSHDEFLNNSAFNYANWKNWSNQFGTSILSFGGGGDSNIAKVLYLGDNLQLEELASAMISKILANDLSGIDLDVEMWWDYSYEQKQIFSQRLGKLILLLRDGFNAAGKPTITISAAVGHDSHSWMAPFFTNSKVMEAIDHIFVMSYVDLDTDFYINKNKIDQLLMGFENANAPMNKLFLGVSPTPNQYSPHIIESVANIELFAQHLNSKGMPGAFFWALGTETSHQKDSSADYIKALINGFGIKYTPENTGLTNHKIDPNKIKKYSNTYERDNSKPKVTAYLSNWSHYSQGYEPNIEELAKYDTVLLSFFGLCGTKVGDPGVVGGVDGLNKSCSKYGLDKFELSMTDEYADIEKIFPNMGMSWKPDLAWLSPEPNGLLGVMKKLHEEKGTRVGISIFGWSLSNIASDAVKPENRNTFINSLIGFIQAYPFIGQLDIDWEYPGIQGASENVFDPINDARNYREFIYDLRSRLNGINRSDVIIGIASGAPRDKIDAAELKSLVDSGVDSIHLMTYDFSGQWDKSLNHHTNLYSPYVHQLSSDEAIQYMIKNLGIPSRNIHLGYANYSRNAIVNDISSFSPILGDFTPQADTIGTFESGVSAINDLFENYIYISDDSKVTGKNGFKLYTDKAANADYLYNEDNKLFISTDTPRSVYSKARYVSEHNLGGIFTWMADHDEGLMLNAAKEGLGYHPIKQVFNMNYMINTCGINVTSDKECSNITNLIESDAIINISDVADLLVEGNSYLLNAEVLGVTEPIARSEWRLRRVKGLSKENITLTNLGDGRASFNVNNIEDAESITLDFLYTITYIAPEKPITLNKTIKYTLSR